MEQEQLQVIKSAGQNDFISFCEIADPKGYIAHWHHELICKKLQENYEKMKKGISTRLILELPPRFGKSRTATTLFPAWVLGKDPTIPIIVSAHTADLAEDFGLETRQVMEYKNYRAIFGTRLRADTKAKGHWATKEGGSYLAVGVGGPITGRGFSLGIIDDPTKNREEADSEVIRNKLWNWYTSTFYTRQEGATMIIVITTRWHLDDLVGRIEENESKSIEAGLPHDDWEYITFPAIAEDDEEFRKMGESLWPEKFSLEQLNSIRNTIGPYDWSSLYQQNPIPSENQEFQEKFFRYFEQKEINTKNLEYITVIDPAISEKETADNSVVTTIAKERDNPNIYRIEETAGHFNPDQLVDIIFQHFEKYKSRVWLEMIAFQKALKYSIIEKQRKTGIYFTVKELKNNRRISKDIRIRGLIPLYGAGVIFHRRSDVEYERELLQFPSGKRVDRIDNMANILEALEERHTSESGGVFEEQINPDPY